MASAFKLMINLKSLSACEQAYMPVGDSATYEPDSMSQCLIQSTVALESLIWGHFRGDNLKNLEEFLPHQHTLKCLHFLRGVGYIDDEHGTRPSCWEKHSTSMFAIGVPLCTMPHR